MIQPRQKGVKNAAPQMRAEYGPAIKKILAGVNGVQMLDPLIARDVSFLDKLAEYLMSDTYAIRSAKQVARKNRSVANRATTTKE